MPITAGMISAMRVSSALRLLKSWLIAWVMAAGSSIGSRRRALSQARRCSALGFGVARKALRWRRRWAARDAWAEAEAPGATARTAGIARVLWLLWLSACLRPLER